MTPKITAFEEVQMPISYSLENKLIYIVVTEFLKPLASGVISQEVSDKFKLELSSALVTNFKFPFTKIDITYEDNILKGLIQYTGGKSLKFELKNNKLNEN